MAKDIETLMKYIGTLSRDERLNPKHMTIFHTLVYMGLLQNSGNQIKITRRQMIETVHISIPTYHKYIADLQRFGYIEYVPSYHPAEGSRVAIKI